MVITNYRGKILYIDSNNQMKEYFPKIEKILRGPVHIFRLLDGKYLITDYDAGQVLFVSPDRTLHKEFTDNARTTNSFYRPHMTTQDPSGNIYVADSWNYRIVKLASDGKFIGWIGHDPKDPEKKGWRKLENQPFTQRLDLLDIRLRFIFTKISCT